MSGGAAAAAADREEADQKQRGKWTLPRLWFAGW